jgi:hypothetical protein
MKAEHFDYVGKLLHLKKACLSFQTGFDGLDLQAINGSGSQFSSTTIRPVIISSFNMNLSIEMREVLRKDVETLMNNLSDSVDRELKKLGVEP